MRIRVCSDNLPENFTEAEREELARWMQYEHGCELAVLYQHSPKVNSNSVSKEKIRKAVIYGVAVLAGFVIVHQIIKRKRLR